VVKELQACLIIVLTVEWD